MRLIALKFAVNVVFTHPVCVALRYFQHKPTLLSPCSHASVIVQDIRCCGYRNPTLEISSPSSAVASPDDDDVYYYIGERLKLEGETENMGVW